ncbi:conserved hypothetical protein, membrane [Candidatus Omnitrophus magneticus]|uniref:PDGLE domain-containing protein n=1 Tax=Candidatus Omnitrophus magneticus TaxID=1609969 RepID=A0A0F0CM99_9BACT|nr:conserved hypothetical protein, membrane [Candidatus Omnitrophus magneticus]KJJ85397.1 conserved hypothetical protein, membrane [Candidatus Omnitrophus magneticus]
MKKKDIIIGLMIAFFLSVFISPFASRWPDGLEKVAEEKGFIKKGEVPPVIISPIPDYMLHCIKNETFGVAFAGLCGTVIVFLVSFSVTSLLKRKE